MLFEQATLLVKEHVGLMKLADNYDLLHPESGQLLGVAKEEPGDVIKYVRLLLGKRFLPTTVNIYEGSNPQPVVRLTRGWTFIRHHAEVWDGKGELLAKFRARLLSIGPCFDVLDPNDQHIATVKGNWVGWTFSFTDAAGAEIGTVTKKWAGLAKEFLTSADNYVINVPVPPKGLARAREVLLAAGLAIDTIYKEQD